MSQMMVDLWNQAADAFDQRYQQIGDQWEASTPCSDFNVQQLVEHTVGVQGGMVAPMVGAELPEGADWPAVKSAVSAALSPESLDGILEGTPMGDVPKARMVAIAISDMTVHVWDLARALGVDDTLPEQLVQSCHEGLKQMPPQMMRAEGRFGPAVEVGDDASAQDQFIAFTGRQP